MSEPASGAGARRVVHARALRVHIPLTDPYRWRGGTIECFDSTITVLVDDTGAAGLGEGTAVEGYSAESPDDVWAEVGAALPTLPGSELADSLARTAARVTAAPFAMASVRGALESLSGEVELDADGSPVRVVGTIRPTPRLDEVGAAAALIAAGHRTLKLKIGDDPDGDRRRVDALRPALGAAVLRLDANQGFDPDQAAHFLRGLDPVGIELVEQPVAAGDWTTQQVLTELSPVPLMLDEAIWNDADIRAAAGRASVIKLKVMKSGGVERAVTQARLAQALGLDVVIGNGVATEIDAYAEAVVARRASLTRDTELNGFAKQAVSPVRRPFALTDGVLDLGTVGRPELDEDVADQLCVDRVAAGSRP